MRVDTAHDIAAMRRKISDSSGGTSGSGLRAMTLSLVRKLDLRGALADIGAGKGDLIRSLLEMDGFSSISGVDLMDRPPDLPSRYLVLRGLSTWSLPWA